MRDNCYVTSEALYHLLGGKAAGWKPMMIFSGVIADALHKQAIATDELKPGDTHWFLQHESGFVLDATAHQFPEGFKVPYDKARGCGFLTAAPSKRANALMQEMLFQ